MFKGVALVTRLGRLTAVAAAAILLSFFGAALTCETASAAAPDGASAHGDVPVGSPGVLSGNVVRIDR